MAGIYIHIPFCKKACHYCNFYFSVSKNLLPEMVKAICKEAELRRSYIHENISTIYFGGGTPSLLPADYLQLIIDKITSFYAVDAGAEITLEANPDDINEIQLSAWKIAGINRLSIGVQSFFEDNLLWMNRAHSAQQAYKSIALATNAGFENITIDFIYGIPGLSNEKWLENLETAKQLQVPHLSCYALTVEQKTALYTMIRQQKKEDIDFEIQSRQFEILMQWAKENGYEHYEISNFAKPGFRSKHNSSYWQGKPYLGLGPSAHSYNLDSRQWNISNNSLYINNLQQHIIPFEKETLSATQKINEYIMTGLRTIEGIELNHLQELATPQITSAIFKDAEKFILQNLMERKNNSLVLTNKGRLLADGITSDLFRV